MGRFTENLATVGRTCGECQACCWAPAIVQIQKPEWSACPFARQSTAGCCSIHRARPRTCQGFRCGWLDGEFAQEHRPDRVGLYVTQMTTSFGQVVRFHEARPHALCEPGARVFIEATGYLDRAVTLGLRRSGVVLLGGPAEAVAEYRRAAERDGLKFENL